MKIIKFQISKEANSVCAVHEFVDDHFYDLVHQHDELQITLIKSGSGTLEVGDHMEMFNPGDLFVIGENQPHVFKSDPSYYEENSSMISQSISVYFDPGPLKKFLNIKEMEEVVRFIRNAKGGLKVSANVANEVVPLMYTQVKLEGIDRLTGLFKMIRLLARRDAGKSLTLPIEDYELVEEDGKRFNDVMSFTYNQYHLPITLTEIADVAAMAPASFCRFFKERTRRTYTQFLAELRIQKACGLLKNKDSSILEICYQCGFSNISNFNRKFKAITGYTPSEYHRLGAN